MATRGKKAAEEPDASGAEVEERAADASDGEIEESAGDYDIPERPNRVLWGIGWGLGRGTRAVHDGLVWIGDSVTGALKRKPLEDEEPQPADEGRGAQEDETAADESPAEDEGSEE